MTWAGNAQRKAARSVEWFSERQRGRLNGFNAKELLPCGSAKTPKPALLAHLRLRRFESRQKRIIHSIQLS
jgi:hypothetical protein